MAKCPNKNLKGWKSLVGKVGEYEAMSLYMRNDENTPNLGRDLKIPASGIVSYQQKINILGRLKKYNSKLGTKHLLRFVPTGESYEGKREYTYVTSLVENWNRDGGDQLSMFQDVADQKQQRDERIEDKMRVFLQNIGVEYTTVSEITDKEGNPLGFAAKADMLNKVVQVVEERAGVDTLPEEAAHFLVNILEAQGDPLVSSMMNSISKYKVYDEVAANPNYQSYSEDKIKKEAIGKAIAKHIINKDADNEFSENLSRLERWFNKLLLKIKKFLNMPTADPYAKAALAILNNEVQNNAAQLITEEQIDMGDYFQDSPMNKQEEIVKKLDATAKELVQAEMDNKELGKQMTAVIDLPEGKTTARYKKVSDGKFIQGRVSDMYQEKLIKKKGVEYMRDLNNRPINEHKRNQGTIHHSTMQNLVDYYAGHLPNTKANLDRIKKQAQFSVDTGQQVMSESQWNVLHQNVKNIIAEINKQQRDINKELNTQGKVTIKAEAMLYAPQADKGKYYADTAGTVDLLVIYSDGSASIYDWKFMSPRQVSGYGQKARIMENPFMQKEDGYNMQIGAYKSILKHFYKVEKIRKSRIIPIHVQYKFKGNPGSKVITPVLDTLKMAFDVEIEVKKGKKKPKLITGDAWLRQLPVADELSDRKGLNKLLSAKLQVREGLKAKLESEKNTEKKQALRYKIEKVDKVIRQMQLDGDIYDLFADAGATIKELERRLPIQDKEDPEYIHMEEFLDFYQDMSSSSLLVEDSAEYLKNLKNNKEEKALKIRLNGAMKQWSVPITQMLEEVRAELGSRVLEAGDAVGIGDNTRAQREFGLLKLFAQSSSHSHPIFQTAYQNISTATNKVRRAEKEIFNETEEHIRALREEFSGEQNAYDMLIDDKTGDLHPKIKKEFWERKDKALEEGDATWIKKHFQLKEDAQKRYDQRKKWAFDGIEKNFPDYDALYEGQELVLPRKSQKATRDSLKAGWLNKNNLTSDSMWAGPQAYIYTEIKEDVLKEQYSDEYLNILKSKSLSNFYAYYQRKNKDFTEMTGMNFKDNFVGNIHRDIIDGLSQGAYTTKSLLQGALEGLQVRQDDSTSESRDENGNLIKTIPILFTSPGTLINSETGEMDIRLKSKDLGKSLHIMSATVHNYVEKTKIESITLALSAYLQDKNTIVLPSDAKGNLMTTITGKIAEKIGGQTAAEQFEKMYVNNALYGQTIQSKDFIFFEKYSGIKTVKALKTWYSANALGFAIIPALAAGTVGKMSIWIESKKATAFNTKQFKEAEKDIYRDKNVFNSINNYFEIWQEDMTFRRSHRLSSGKLVKYVSLDFLFSPFRKVDNLLDNTVLNAMMRNYGVDKNLMPKRLELLPEGTKSLRDIFSVDTSNGTVYTGLSEEGENRFREMVQYTTGSIKGSMRADDISPIDTTLIGSLFMQFKGWAPRVLQERFGDFRYNQIMDTYEQGRYSVAKEELIHTELAMLDNIKQTGLKFAQWAGATVTFGLYDGIKMDEQKAEKAFHKYKMENLDDPNIQNMDKAEFFSMKRAQLRAMAAELKALLTFTIAIFALGMEGDDGEPVYTKTWFTRKLNMILHKARLELGFALNPSDWTQVFRSPIPLTGLAVDLQKAIGNFSQESYDLINGIDNKRDNTGFGYRTFRLFPGFKQLARWIELSETDKKNPYQNQGR